VRRWTKQTTEGMRWLRTIGRENRGGSGAFALLERGSHIAPLRLGGSRFAVNVFVPPNRSRVQNSSMRRGRQVRERAWFTGAADVEGERRNRRLLHSEHVVPERGLARPVAKIGSFRARGEPNEIRDLLD